MLQLLFDAPLQELSTTIKNVQNGVVFTEQCSLKVGSSGWAAEATAGKRVWDEYVCDSVITTMHLHTIMKSGPLSYLAAM